ncbi:tetratricopeptide (TPR) repeat protein [Paraburkholderia sp. WC7.3g]|uniref:Tetratricopeptide repeat protein n=1 Tax=Paraburkholderia podalyriae TaxID=1938811 RepID=A0ABR7PI50_9BURK|nr:tetratricopeptide repeat protein [Paraburkholderia podalyriae]MBC8746055.1 tetratricopeptide repeat protein [Paraburkholderia podalyriae]
MKHSSGRARSAATLATTAFGDVVGSVVGRATFEAARALAWRVTVVAALAAMPLASAYAQKAAVMPQGPAVRDNTPEIDASIAQKNWQAALTQLDSRVAANPRDAQAKFKRANVLVHLNRDDEAIAAFTELTQLYPELPEPYNNLATLFARQGRLTEARAALEMATKVNPNYALAFENLGDLYLRLADAAYRRAESLGKPSARTSQRLADIQKVVSPAPAAAASQPAAAPTNEPAAHPTSNVTDNPSFQFGGPNGSLAMPPYMAPSR